MPKHEDDDIRNIISRMHRKRFNISKYRGDVIRFLRSRKRRKRIKTLKFFYKHGGAGMGDPFSNLLRRQYRRR